jgi:hypothetical protein
VGTTTKSKALPCYRGGQRERRDLPGVPPRSHLVSSSGYVSGAHSGILPLDNRNSSFTMK